MIKTEETYVIEPLGNHDRTEFSSGVPALDQYLKNHASQDIKKNIAVTYVLTENGKKDVYGYYSLSTVGIFPGELAADLIKKLPRYPMLPGVLLGRLAVDEKYKGQGFGSFLLVDALKRSIDVSKQIGIVAVVVEAKDDNAISFYKHFGFLGLPENKFKLFLPLKTLKTLGL
jgi:GNAT superfamily N-acetyltransferase